MTFVGCIAAVTEAAAIKAAVVLFGPHDEWRKRPAVNLRRYRSALGASRHASGTRFARPAFPEQ
jgi:hypothetical protein